MKKAVLLVLIAFGVLASRAQTPSSLSDRGIVIDPDKRVMLVLATLEMAASKDQNGKFEPFLNPPLSPGGEKFREQLFADTADLPVDLRLRIENFVSQHKRRHASQTDAEIIAPFISMAYTLTPAPELNDPLITSDLPGSLLDVLDFAPLVREFYRRSSIASKLDDYVKEYRTVADSTLKTSTRDMVNDMLGYLHTRPRLTVAERVRVETPKQGSKKITVAGVEVRQHDRHFYVVPEALAPKGTLNFLNIRDDYYLIVPPDTDLSGSEARRAFLRFVIDPLVLENEKDLGPIRDWAKPILDDLRKKNAEVTADPFLSMSRSLVAAIDIRQNEFFKANLAKDQARKKIVGAKTDAEKKQVTDELARLTQSFVDERALELYEEYERGNIMSFYFLDQLVGVEDSGFDISSSLKEMIASFDPAKETGRVERSAESRKRALAAREAHTNVATTLLAENPVTTRLLEIQKTIDARDLPKAATDLKALLAQYPQEPRIYYNIGRVASLAATKLDDADAQAAKLLEAKIAYSNVINTAAPTTDPALLSLTYVALAKIYEFNNDPAYAMKLYDAAIKIGDVTGGAMGEATAGKQRLLKPQQ